jgi:UDP-GlcNAc:undecaprenyl-phosphate GlcNAc-1-phosphate transferase
MPRQDRWHKKPVALHGGVGFYPAFIMGSAVVLNWKIGVYGGGSGSTDFLPDELHLAAAILLGSFVMFLLGLFDDMKQFRPSTKLLFEFIAASLFIFAGGIFPLTGVHVVDVLFTYFWFIGIINAVNMLDNMDGLSSGVVVLAGLTLIILALEVNGLERSASLAVSVGLVFVAALLGFWVHNRPPATIFMGDSGSLFIGYVLAAMAVPSSFNGFMNIQAGSGMLGPVMVLLIPSAVLAVPIFDTTFVTITRKWRAQKASQGGRDHSSHCLVGLGLSEKKTVWILYSFAAFGGVVAVLMQQFQDQTAPLLGIFLLILVLTGVYLGHVKVQVVDPNRRPPAWTPLVSELLYKRRAGEVLWDAALIILCFYGAYLLRFEGMLSQPVMEAIRESLPLVAASCLLAFFLAGIYRGQWRLISVSDVPSYAVGTLGGSALSLAVVTLATRFGSGHSRTAYAIFGLLVFIALVGSRLSFRLLDFALLQNGSDATNGNRKPVLIYGAGKAGKLLHEEIMGNPQMKDYTVLGFIDDDPNRVGRMLCGFPVKNGMEWLGQPLSGTPEIWISSQFVPDKRAQQLARHWEGQATVRRLRLRMEPVGSPGEAGDRCGQEFRPAEHLGWTEGNPQLEDSGAVDPSPTGFGRK